MVRVSLKKKKALKKLISNMQFLSYFVFRRLIDPINVPDVRGIIEEKIGTLKVCRMKSSLDAFTNLFNKNTDNDFQGCFGLQTICNEEVLNAVRGRKSRQA